MLILFHVSNLAVHLDSQSSLTIGRFPCVLANRAHDSIAISRCCYHQSGGVPVVNGAHDAICLDFLDKSVNNYLKEVVISCADYQESSLST